MRNSSSCGDDRQKQHTDNSDAHSLAADGGGDNRREQRSDIQARCSSDYFRLNTRTACMRFIELCNPGSLDFLYRLRCALDAIASMSICLLSEKQVQFRPMAPQIRSREVWQSADSPVSAVVRIQLVDHAAAVHRLQPLTQRPLGPVDNDAAHAGSARVHNTGSWRDDAVPPSLGARRNMPVGPSSGQACLRLTTADSQRDVQQRHCVHAAVNPPGRIVHLLPRLQVCHSVAHLAIQTPLVRHEGGLAAHVSCVDAGRTRLIVRGVAQRERPGRGGDAAGAEQQALPEEVRRADRRSLRSAAAACQRALAALEVDILPEVHADACHKDDRHTRCRGGCQQEQRALPHADSVAHDVAPLQRCAGCPSDAQQCQILMDVASILPTLPTSIGIRESAQRSVACRPLSREGSAAARSSSSSAADSLARVRPRVSRSAPMERQVGRLRPSAAAIRSAAIALPEDRPFVVVEQLLCG